MTIDEMKSRVEEEWRWCLVGNIVETHKYGEQHEIRKGTKHFPPGAKVYINMVYGGYGHEKVLVIGQPRKQCGLIEVVIPRRYITNFRIQRVYKPAVLKRMAESEHEWWGNTEKDRETILGAAKWMNEVDI